jgi:two-component system CheB/CheR fusion protein
MAFVIVTHLSPEHKSALAEILSRNTSMPVREVTEKTTIEPNRVYIIPPNHNLSISGGDVIPEPLNKEAKLLRLPIDHFLASLAEQRRGRAIGVVLSGTGSDGTKGVQAIKAEGGITFSQKEETAKFPEMPRNATASGRVDYVLSPEEIAANIVKIKPRIGYLAGTDEEYIDPSKENAFQRVIATLRSRKGIDLSHYRRSTLNRRITRRMILRNVDKIEDYAKLIDDDAKEAEALFQDALINVTNFYRDRDAFDALKVKVFPNIVGDKDVSMPVRIWVPACSTGEEAYTIAISLLEYLGEKGDDVAIQILATDVNEQTIGKAKIGAYGENAIKDLPADVVGRYFTQTQPGTYRVNESIRDVCTFSRHNVLEDSPFADMDLISCRNLLIYLDNTLQERIFTLFYHSLKSRGYLMLGKSESAARFRDLFEDVDKSNRIYVKKASRGRNTTPNDKHQETGV